jgi:hypothetical protein
MMKLLYAGLLVWILLSMVLAGCDVGTPAAATPAATGSDWGYTSKYLNTSYSGALSVMNQLVLGTMKLEGTANTVTPAQAKALLPLWQSFQGSALRDNAERSAVLAAIENAMTPVQLQAIAAMQLTGNDLQAWAQQQGLSFGPPGGGQGTPPAALATGQAGGSGVDPTARAAMRATAQAGGGFPGGGQGGGGFPGGQGTGGRPSAGQGTFGPMLNPLIELLTKRAAE